MSTRERRWMLSRTLRVGRASAKAVPLVALILPLGCIMLACAHVGPGAQKTAPGGRTSGSVVWTIDRLEQIGGHATTVLGDPRVIATPEGRAVEFDGVDDGLFVDSHPLAGAESFTWEVVLRPDPGGGAEQRLFHLQERDSTQGRDTASRLLLETRVVDGKWCLDSYARSFETGQTLIDRGRLHPLGVWHHVAMVYDGKELSHYVDGVLQGAAQIRLAPQGAGHSSIGVRINKVSYFKGAIRLARFTRRALPPEEFLKPPRNP